jgi:hypothetical protein
MGILYILNDGTITSSPPLLFEEREKMKDEYTVYAKNLKYTKKFTGGAFIEEYLYNPYVIMCRGLMKNIWGFKPDLSKAVKEEKLCCDKCLETENLNHVWYEGYSGHQFTDTLCETHAKTQKHLYPDAIITPLKKGNE